MSVMASRITSITMVYSTVYSGAEQGKHQSSVSLAFVRGIHRLPVNSPHKGPVTRKMFPFDDVIMKMPICCQPLCFHRRIPWRYVKVMRRGKRWCIATRNILISAKMGAMHVYEYGWDLFYRVLKRMDPSGTISIRFGSKCFWFKICIERVICEMSALFSDFIVITSESH